ncbi:hypothetical protein PN462_09560 [Spirulina sp. CS-785/01]|uniref:hypothetical protein n=1 Tax=Spirulina sp. CS-785/01 TaxID=3021716 RepID=UPI00232C55A6|nr:hypothetical protein [Spirulina sp. CS-785/01]MDB9313344.1 hypothetical protein [Spirulina sp. CS-785/01]
METQINCAEACVNGCVLGDKCPNKEYGKQASQFIHSTSMDKIHEIAEEARRKKMLEPPKWVIPDEI